MTPRRRLAALVALAALALAAGPARAEICASDVVPAATLIAPYVVVEMDGASPRPGGWTTILSITNVSHEAALAQLTVWAADGTAVYTLTEALSGFDVWRINFSDLLSGRWSAFDTSRAAGAPPNTEPGYPFKRAPFEWGPDGRSAYEGPAPFTVPYPRGLDTPQKTSDLPGAGCAMPYGDAAGAAAAPLVVAALQDPLYARVHQPCPGTTDLRHQPDWLGTLGENPLVFYATVDVVAQCTTAVPGQAGYPAAGRNVLLGDLTYVDPAALRLEVLPAVHVESGDRELRPGPYEARSGLEDHLEPLPTSFAVRYRNESGSATAPTRATQLMVWKPFADIRVNDGRVDDCDGYLYYAWDEDEHSVTTAGSAATGADPNELPFATQLVPLDKETFDLPGPSGWMLLLLPPSYGPFEDPTDSTATDLLRTMAAVATRAHVTWAGGAAAATWRPAAVEGNAHCETTVRSPRRPRRHL